MKRFLLVCSALSLSAMLVACGGEEEETPEENEGTEQTEEMETEEEGTTEE